MPGNGSNHPLGDEQWKLGACDEAERAVDLDRAQVLAFDVKKGHLARAQHAVDDPGDERASVTASLRVGVCAHAAHLAQMVDPHALSGHRDEPALVADADE